MVTFPVSAVDLADRPLPALDREQALRSLLHMPVEQLGPGGALVICNDQHALVAAAYSAFYDHRPLVLSPDMIWFCIAQGFAQHVALNAEQLRERFVRFEGKLKLVVNRPDFFLGQVNPWPEMFASFADLIAEHVGRLRDLVVADFSTTGPVERAALHVLLMDTFEPYFEYEARCGCGIPSITLLGTPDDWRSLRQRALVLSEYGLEDWISALLPILDQLIATSEGRIDQEFWRSFFHYESGSMISELTGWIQVLFPYLIGREAPDRSQKGAIVAAVAALEDELEIRLAAAATKAEQVAIRRETRRKIQGLLFGREMLEPNPYLLSWAENLRKPGAPITKIQGPSLGVLPGSIASAPLHFVDMRDGAEHDLLLVSGMFGVVQHADTGALQPEFSWAVLHDREPAP